MEPADRPTRILTLRFGRIGDLIAFTPALRALRRAHTGSEIDLVTTPTGSEALATVRGLDRIHALRWRRFPWWLNPEKRRLVERLRARAFDMAFVFETARRYHSLVEPLEIPVVYGFTPAEGSASTPGVRFDPTAHMVDNCLRLLRAAGIPDAGRGYDYPIRDAARARAARLLATWDLPDHAPLVGIHPGQYQRRRPWRRAPPSKAWPLDRFAEVIHGLHRRSGGSFVLTGTTEEAPLVRDLQRRVSDIPTAQLAGRTDLETLAAILERCDLLIAPDTGPAHLAAAVGTALVVLFGPTPPWVMSPQGDEDRIRRLYVDVDPAVSTAAERRRGRGYDPRMLAIQVEHVLDAAAALDPRFAASGGSDGEPRPRRAGES